MAVRHFFEFARFLRFFEHEHAVSFAAGPRRWRACVVRSGVRVPFQPAAHPRVRRSASVRRSRWVHCRGRARSQAHQARDRQRHTAPPPTGSASQARDSGSCWVGHRAPIFEGILTAFFGVRLGPHARTDERADTGVVTVLRDTCGICPQRSRIAARIVLRTREERPSGCHRGLRSSPIQRCARIAESVARRRRAPRAGRAGAAARPRRRRRTPPAATIPRM